MRQSRFKRKKKRKKDFAVLSAFHSASLGCLLVPQVPPDGAKIRNVHVLRIVALC